MDFPYRCIHCSAQRWHRERDVAACRSCDARFPELEGVPVFLPRAEAALHAYLGGLGDIELQFEQLQTALRRAAPDVRSESMQQRARRMLEGMEHDLSLMRSVYQPLEAYLRDRPPLEDFVAWASIQTGLSLHDMFIYFYQDWFGTAEFGGVKAAFASAIRDYCRDLESVAVLGAGACGLAHALATPFQRSFAVDLSLPTLLLARRFIAGQALRLHLKRATWRPVTLEPPAAPPHALQFLVANVTNLPFQDGSLSTVVTQCLFDVVDNPLQLAEEIQRVLKPDGLWINFSHAFDAPGDPIELSPRTLAEVPEVISPLGFEPLWLERRRFVMLDASAIDPEAARTDDEVHFFGFRKRQGAGRAPFRALRERLLSDDGSLWAARPMPVPGKEVSLSETRSFGAPEREPQTELRVGPYPMPIPGAYAELLAGLLQQVNGRNTLREVFAALQRTSPELDEQTFMDLIYCLSVERYLIDLGMDRAA